MPRSGSLLWNVSGHTMEKSRHCCHWISWQEDHHQESRWRGETWIGRGEHQLQDMQYYKLPMASTKYPCLSCGKTVTSNQNAVMCIICNEWIHLACSSLDYEFFHSDLDFFCTRCLMSELPFNNSDDKSLIHDALHVVTDHKKLSLYKLLKFYQWN